jgi:hypothetical protein
MADSLLCNLCGRKIPPHAHYLVRIEVFADPSSVCYRCLIHLATAKPVMSTPPNQPAAGTGTVVESKGTKLGEVGSAK